DQREPNNHRRIQCCLIDTRGERNCGRQLGCLIPLCRHSRFHQKTMAPWDGCLTSSGSARCMISKWLALPTVRPSLNRWCGVMFHTEKANQTTNRHIEMRKGHAKRRAVIQERVLLR